MNFWGDIRTKYVRQYLKEKCAHMEERQVFTQRVTENCPTCEGVKVKCANVLDTDGVLWWEEHTDNFHHEDELVYLGAEYMKIGPDSPYYTGL